MQKLTVKGTRFVDGDGREVLLQGINFVCKEKKLGYLWPDHRRLFSWFARSGFNVIRLGIFWDGVEPQPGVFDDAYLDKIGDVISDAEAENLYVLIDMHQDLWSVRYMDGAPEWATITDGAEHPADYTMWYEAYLRSEAIINAADHFWKNDPAEDGIGLMDHYASMWEHIARRLDDHDNIIGYEPMNEPFMGSLARNTFGLAENKTKEKFPEFDLASMQGITPESQAYMGEIVSRAFMEFDRNTLMPFYQKMNDSIRRVSKRALATGGNIYCSANFTSGIGRVNGPDKKPEEQQIYAPHGYDSVVDSDNYDNFNPENVAALFADKRMTQERLGMPVLAGEWGAFPSREFTNGLIDQMNGILETYLWSSTYWWYLPGMETDENYSALKRAYPAVTEGELRRYHYDRQKEVFEVSWEGKEVLCFLPFEEYEMSANAGTEVQTVKSMDGAVYVRITAAGDREVSAVISRK